MAAPTKLREAAFSDYEAIADLKRRGGIVVDSIENWRHLWVQNPALCHIGGLAIGWVLETQGRIVGYLGNIALLYRFAGKTLTAVTGTGFVVDPEYRAMSLTLDSAFYRQRSVDLHLATTAVEAVGRMAVAFRSAPLPQPDFDAILFWVLQPYPFAQAVAKKLELAPAFMGVSSVLASLAVQSDRIVRRRWPRQCAADLEIAEISVTEIDDEFQTFWEEKSTEPRLYADRSSAALRWHFNVPGYRGKVRILRCRRHGELTGYAVVRNDPARPDGVRATVVTDLIARHGDEETLRALFVAIFEIARRADSCVLEVMGFPPNIRKVLLESKPYVRKLPSCPYYYRANDPILRDALSNAEAWYACAYDGDRTLMP